MERGNRDRGAGASDHGGGVAVTLHHHLVNIEIREIVQELARVIEGLHADKEYTTRCNLGEEGC